MKTDSKNIRGTIRTGRSTNFGNAKRARISGLIAAILIAAAAAACFSSGSTAAAPPAKKSARAPFPRFRGSSTAKATGTISLPTWSPAGDRIAFIYSKYDNTDIFTIGINGDNPVNISNNPDTDEFPVWSPDGSSIAFVSKRNGNYDICLASKTGQGLRCPTEPGKKAANRGWDDRYPAWSPDGRTLAYCSYSAGFPQIWFIGADGSNPRQFYDKEACYPNFSSDGRKLAFASEGDLNSYDLKKGRSKNLTEKLIDGSMIDDTIPIWAPKGNKIAFVARYEAFQSEIYAISGEGKGIRRITVNLYEDFMPRWQPDGKGIVYAGYVNNRSPEIFVVNPESLEKTRITDNFYLDFSPSFSPDGKKILFVRRIGGRDVLYIVDKDGKNERQLFPREFNPDLPRKNGKNAPAPQGQGQIQGQGLQPLPAPPR